MSSTQFGRIKTWRDERGFGFIHPEAGGADVFLHIKAWPAPTHPQLGERVQYQIARSGDGKRHAVQVRRLAGGGSGAGSRSSSRPAASGNTAAKAAPTANRAQPKAVPPRATPRHPKVRGASTPRQPERPQGRSKRGSIPVLVHGLLAALLCLLLGLSLWGHAPRWLPLLYVGMSVLTFAVYAHDKSAAQSDAWRVPEKTLLLLGLACGWPGALLAQHRLRHKSSKTAFLLPFWLTVVLNVGALLWLSQRGWPVW